ncbi:N-acetylmuramidase domain-containing protein [Vibrio owensii]|uniref:N-acetylmuramidase domain-containing protein n=1 Tax=Vibrio owensii TaxID=696485 RepID=UPI003AAD3484
MASIRISGSVGLGGKNVDGDIRTVQRSINQLLGSLKGVKELKVDGKLGSRPENSKTVGAIKAFQKKLVGMARPDGRIDVNGRSHRKLNDYLKRTPETAVAYTLPLVGSRDALTDLDYRKVAETLGCEVAAIKAVAEVESRGEAYFSNGKPKILFEAHIFSRLTSRAYDNSHPSISSRHWNRSLYVGGISEYVRLNKAIELNSNAAIRSASWGRFQIMGFNFKLAGHVTAESFVKAVFESEKKQLEAFVTFIQKSGLGEHIRDKNWAAFARGYNGSEYQKNQYDVKLEKAYKKYASIKNAA